MKIKTALGIALGLLLSYAGASGAGDGPVRLRPTSPQYSPPTADAPRPTAAPARVKQAPALMFHEPTVDEARQELKDARAAYRRTVKMYGKKSAAASLARQRLEAARDGYRMARQTGNEVIEGGGGTSGGASETGSGRISP